MTTISFKEKAAEVLCSHTTALRRTSQQGGLRSLFSLSECVWMQHNGGSSPPLSTDYVRNNSTRIMRPGFLFSGILKAPKSSGVIREGLGFFLPVVTGRMQRSDAPWEPTPSSTGSRTSLSTSRSRQRTRSRVSEITTQPTTSSSSKSPRRSSNAALQTIISRSLFALTLWMSISSGSFAQIVNNSSSSEGLASWYSSECCKYNPHKGCPTASGESLFLLEKTSPDFAAMWGVPLQSKFRVTNLDNGKSVIVTVKDRGPAKRLHRAIDLSKSAFSKIANPKKGLIKVRIERLP